MDKREVQAFGRLSSLKGHRPYDLSALGSGIGDAPSVVIGHLKAIDARIDDRVYAALSVESSVAARASYGGTAPAEVLKRVAEARLALGLDGDGT